MGDLEAPPHPRTRQLTRIEGGSGEPLARSRGPADRTIVVNDGVQLV